MIDVSTKLQPNIPVFDGALQTDVDSITRKIIKDFAELAPIRMRESMVEAPSAKGGAPARRSGYLSDTLKGTVIDATTGQIEMAFYAQYLDPFLGGKLDRPFIEQAIAKTLDELLV